MLAQALAGRLGHWCCLAVLLSLLPALVLGQASKTSQIASATKTLSTLGASSASSFCTAYIGGKPKTVATFMWTGVSTVNAVATSTSTLPSGASQRSTTVTSTSTATRTTTWTRATQYPETEDRYTTQTATLIEPEYTQELPGTTTLIPSNTATVTTYYRKKRHDERAVGIHHHVERAVAVPTPLQQFPASILSSACSTYLGTSTSSFTHSFFTGTTTATVSTKWVTETPPPVTSTRIVTTTRLALVTTTAQETATRVNINSETVTQYSGTTTTVNPDYTTTELGPGTKTVYTSVPSPVPEAVIDWDGMPGGWLQLDGFYGLRWQNAAEFNGYDEMRAYSEPNHLSLGGWNPVIRTFGDTATLTLRSLTCVTSIWSPDGAWVAVVGSIGGAEVYVKRLNCPPQNAAVNDFRAQKLPAVNTISFLKSTDEFDGAIDNLTFLPY